MHINFSKSVLGVSLLTASILFTGCGSNNIPMEPVNAKTLELSKLKEQYPDINVTQQDIDKGNIPMRNIYLTIKPVVHALGKWSEQKEAYYETRTVYKKITVEDNRGRDTTITVPTNETIYHPARIAWHAIANLEFVITSPDGKKVYMIVDNRDRVEETDTSGMLGRICNDLVDDISRN